MSVIFSQSLLNLGLNGTTRWSGYISYSATSYNDLRSTHGTVRFNPNNGSLEAFDEQVNSYKPIEMVIDLQCNSVLIAELLGYVKQLKEREELIKSKAKEVPAIADLLSTREEVDAKIDMVMNVSN